jgi:CsoR family transcriptional regulator, copper-sensing transcriptional repressor
MIDPFKTQALRRLRKARGQIDGIIKMIEEEKYCVDILTQVLAMQGAVKGVSKLVFESHLNTCGDNLSSSNKKKKEQFISELMKISDLTGR